MKRGLFLDRDGVINVEKNYLYKIEDFEFINGIFETAHFFQKKGFKIFIITNQSGIGRGYYSLEDFNTLTSWMIKEFEKNGVKISQVELCPHSPNVECNCRKPKIGMIENILKNHDIDLENSILIGDKDSDIKCAKNAKIATSIQVKTGHKFDETKSEATFVCDSIKEVIQFF